MRNYFHLIILFFVLICNSFLSAQEESSEFATLKLGVSVVKDFNSGGFQQNWEPQIGVEGYFGTPFYVGNLQAGLLYSAFGSLEVTNPDFKLFCYYLQWDYEFVIFPSVHLAFGGRTGLIEMIFNENDIVTDVNLLNETEFTAGIISRLSFSITSRWQLNVSASYLHIFTYPRMNSFFLGAGISKSFNTPLWLKEFLK